MSCVLFSNTVTFKTEKKRESKERRCQKTETNYQHTYSHYVPFGWKK